MATYDVGCVDTVVGVGSPSRAGSTFYRSTSDTSVGVDVPSRSLNYPLYDYLDVVTPDKDVTLNVRPQEVIPEYGEKTQVVHIGDDDSEERISLSTETQFYVTLKWTSLRAGEAAQIFDFWYSPNKGNGMLNSFKWVHPFDGHTYVVRFASDLSRDLDLRVAGKIGEIREIKLRVLGKVS